MQSIRYFALCTPTRAEPTNMNQQLLKLLQEHPDAILKCIESSFESTNTKDMFKVRGVSYHADMNTIYIYYYS